MRVLLDCRMATWSGIGRYTTGLARALAAHDDLELVQICRTGEAPPVVPRSNVEARIAAAHPFGVRGALELGRLVRASAPDIVHCTHFPTPVPVDRPLVVTLHDLAPLVVEGVLPSAAKREIYRLWNYRAAHRAERIIVPSRATAEDVGSLFPEARGKLAVIPEAADDFSSGPLRPLPDMLAEAAAQPYFLSMGNSRPHKDLPTLLRAFSLMQPSSSVLRLLLVGTEPPGYLRKVLADASSEVRTRVLFTGPVDDSGLRALYAGALAFIFPSRHEGFGLPPLEAMSLGTPVVCSGASSLPEVVGDAALLFPARDVRSLVNALELILDDAAIRKSLSEAGRDRAARFTWERTAAATVRVYQEAMRTHALHSKRKAGPVR